MPAPPASTPISPASATPLPTAPRGPKAMDFKLVLARTTPAARPGPAPPPATLAAPPAPAGRAVAAAAGLPAAWNGAARPPSNAAFRQRIAEAERSAEHPGGGYTQRNAASGALGRYQFIPIALRDIGWRDAGGGWTALARNHGVSDEASFLANPAAQEAAMTAYLARQETILQRTGLLNAAGSSVRAMDGSTLRITESGLVAATHLCGAGTVARYLAYRQQNPEATSPAGSRGAFAGVERRLRDFTTVAYASARNVQLAAR